MFQGTDAASAAAAGDSPAFVGVKIHDNNFFVTQSAWLTVYLNDGKRPPWDTSVRAPLLSAAEQDAMWALYEQTAQYIAVQSNRITPVDVPQVLDMLGGR